MNPIQLKQIIEAVVNDFDKKIGDLTTDVNLMKDNFPDIEKVLASVKGKDGIDGKNPIYGVDWKLTEEEMQNIIDSVKPVEGLDYNMPEDGKDAVITDELIKKIVSQVKALVKDGRDGKNGTDGKNGENGTDGLDGSPDTPKEVKDKLETLKGDSRLDKSAVKGLDEIISKPDLDRAISILDQRTQYLINKVSNSSGSSVTVGANEIAYGDTSGNIISDSLATRDSTTKETSIGMPVYAVGSINDGISQEVVWKADNTGSIGNSITLVFDGVDDTDTVLAVWNAANPSNTASVIGGTGNFVPAADTIILSGGGTVSFQTTLDALGQGYPGIGSFYDSGSSILAVNGMLNTGDLMRPFIVSADFAGGDIGLAQFQPGRVDINSQRGSNGDSASLKLDSYSNAVLKFNGTGFGESGIEAGDGTLKLFNANYYWTFPVADGSNGDSLITDGAGTLSWGASGGLAGYTDANNTALGQTTGVTGLGIQNTFLGNKAGASLSAGDDNIFIGFQAMGVSTAVPANNAIVIGAQQNVYAWFGSDDFVAIGKNTIGPSGIGAGSVIIGSGASSATADGVAIGFGATSGGVGSIAIGSGASSIGHTNSIAIGQQAINTASNQFVVGSNSYAISDFYFGSGVRNGLLPNNVNMNATGGVGTNAAGGQFLFYGGASTGTGVGGDIRMYVAPAVGMSGSSDNPYHMFLSLGANKISKFGDIDDAYYGLRLDIDNNAGGINLGNMGGAGGNSTRLSINDASKAVATYTDGAFTVLNTGGDTYFNVQTNTGNVQIGDVDGITNKTVLGVLDGSSLIYNYVDGGYQVGDTSGNLWLNMSTTGHLVYIGDASGSFNNTLLTVDDSNQLITVTKPLILKGYTVATLPAGTVGMTAYVTDALAPAFGVAVAGSGAVTIPVFYDGASWIVG